MRKDVDVKNVLERLKHKKECNVSNTRIFNKRSKDIDLAYNLLDTGKLVSEGECVAITDIETLRHYKDRVLTLREYVLDMETTGLDIYNDIIVGMCIYVDGLKSAYIPINHTDINNVRYENQLTEEQVKEEWREVFESADVSHILHNAKYDYKCVLWNWGIAIENVYFDTLIGSFLLNENEPHGLKPLYNKYILKGKGDDLDFGDYFGDTPFNYIPISVATVYGANDGIKTYKLYQFQRQYITKTHNREDFRKIADVMFNIEMPLIPLLADIELRGVEIRVDYANKLAEEMRKELEDIKKSLDRDVESCKEDIIKMAEKGKDLFFECSDEPISKSKEKYVNAQKLIQLMGADMQLNYSSPQQIQIFLYDILGMKNGSRKKPRGTGKDEIGLLLEKYPKVTFLQNFLNYKKLMKLLTTYVEKLPNIIEPKTNAVHTQFNQLGAKTGRFSSSDTISKLNLQNIPSREKRIRKIFKAREGYYFVGGDFSQIEPRTLASLSGDETMQNAYKENKDLYSIMASDVYGVPVDECKEFRADGTVNDEGKARRTSMKSVLLGIMYERGAKSIAEQLGKTDVWAERLIEDFNKAYPKIKEFATKVIYQAENLGYVNTLFGRKRRLADMQLPKDDFKYKEAHRQCLNAVIQGTAGDIMKLAMINLWRDEEARKIGVKMCMTIHDELICEVPKENVKAGKECIARVMKETGQKALGLPMKCDLEVTEVWYGDSIEI